MSVIESEHVNGVEIEPHLRKTLVFSIFDGAAYSGFFLLSQGFLLTAIGLYFNASEFVLSLAYALPSAFQFFQLVTPFILDRVRSRKKIVLIFSTVSRLPWVVLAVAAAVGLRDEKLFFYMFMISQLALTISGNAWNSWMRDLVPEDLRGRFFGVRNLASSLVVIFATILYSRILDLVFEPYNYLLSMVLGIAFGFVSIVFLTMQFEPPPRVYGALAGLKACVTDGNFRKFMLYTIVWNVAVYVSAPYFPLYQIRFLKLSYSTIGSYAVLASAISIPAYYLWGVMVDEFGSKSVAQIGIFTVAWLPIVWLFMGEQSMHYLLIVDAVVAGVGWAAVNLAVFSLSFEVSGFQSSAYFALFFTSTAIGSILGSVVGGFLGEFLVDQRFSLLDFRVEGIKFMFLISSAFRFISLLVLHGVRTKRYERPVVVVQTAMAVLGRRLLVVPRYAGQAIHRRITRSRAREKRSG